MLKLTTLTPEQQLLLAKRLLQHSDHYMLKKDFIKAFFRDSAFAEARKNLIDDHVATTIKDEVRWPWDHYDSTIVPYEPIWTPQLLYSVDHTQHIGKYGIKVNGIYSARTLHDVLDETERISVMIAVVERRKIARTKPPKKTNRPSSKRYNPQFSHTLEGLSNRYDLDRYELPNMLFPLTLANLVSRHISQTINQEHGHKISFDIMPDDSTVLLFKRAAELHIDEYLCCTGKMRSDRMPKADLAKFWLSLGISIQSALWMYYEPIPPNDPAAAQGKTRRYPLRAWIRTFFFQIPQKRMASMSTFENIMDFAVESAEYEHLTPSQRSMRRFVIEMYRDDPHDIHVHNMAQSLNIRLDAIPSAAAAAAPAPTRVARVAPTAALAKALSAPKR